jgi:hypothetical protein
MSEDENVFPMDITDRNPSSRPSKWRPQGYLVTILADAEEAKRAENALVQSGIAPRDVKLYGSEEILANHEIYMGRRSAAGKAVGAFVDDAEGRELYLGYAREGSLRDVGPDPERGRCFQSASSACGLRPRARALLRAGYAAGLSISLEQLMKTGLQTGHRQTR